MRNTGIIARLIGGVIVLGAVVVGVVLVTGLANKKRTRKIMNFVGFDSQYWRTAGKTIAPSEGKELADRVHDAVGVFNDNEEAILGVLRRAKTAGNLSYISYQFENRHKESMGGWIGDYLDRKQETKQVLDALENIEI